MMKNQTMLYLAFVTGLPLCSTGYSQEPGIGPAISRMQDRPGDCETVELNLSPPEDKTVTFTIPVEDIIDYRYQVAYFGNGSASMNSATPDDFGVIHAEVGKRRVVDAMLVCGASASAANTRPREQEYYYLVAEELASGQVFYYFDLPQVALGALLESLQQSLVSPGLSRDERMAFLTRRAELMRIIHAETRDIYLSLAGEKISLEQTFDEIYIRTGCQVEVQEDLLSVSGCP